MYLLPSGRCSSPISYGWALVAMYVLSGSSPSLAQQRIATSVPVSSTSLLSQLTTAETSRQSAVMQLLDSLTAQPGGYSNEPREWSRTTPFLLPVDRVSVMGSYPLAISSHKTSHIIFPAKIKDFDAGSSHVLALIPETAGNVLRVKSAGSKPFGETNMTILTEDGGFYSFLVRYDPEPEVLNINIVNNARSDKEITDRMGINQAARLNGASAVLGGGVGSVEITHTCADVQRNKKSFIRNVGAAKQDCSLTLSSIYVAGKTMYFGLTMANASAIDFEVDFLKVYLRDRDVLKRMAAQEVELPILANYPVGVTTFKGKTEYKLVYALPLRTFTEDKVIELELYERGGGRHLRFQVESDIMIKARSL